MPDTSQQRHAMLAEEIRRHDRAYYVEAQSAISDKEYDQLYRTTQSLTDTLEKQLKTNEGIKSFVDDDGLEPFLRQTDILINVLPLTPATEDILSARSLSMLPPGASVINIGRGQHIVDQDLIDLLDSGHLAGATLDVFRQEPLATDHPFWKHPKITLMPHTARKTRPIDIVPQIKENVLRLRANRPLLQVIDIHAGY